MLGHAWLVTALNPKGLTFFVAFLPQFIDPRADFWTQMLIFEATFVCLAFANAVGYGLVARGRATMVQQRAGHRHLQPSRRLAADRRGRGRRQPAQLAIASTRRAVGGEAWTSISTTSSASSRTASSACWPTATATSRSARATEGAEGLQPAPLEAICRPRPAGGAVRRAARRARAGADRDHADRRGVRARAGDRALPRHRRAGRRRAAPCRQRRAARRAGAGHRRGAG